MDFEKFIHVESEWRRKKTLESDNRLQMHVEIPFRSGDAFSIRVLKVIWYFSFYREKCIFALSHLCARTKSMAKMAFSLPANTMRRQWIMFSQVLFFTVVHRKCISKMYYRCWSLRFFLHQLCCLLFGSFVRYKWFRSIFKLYTCSSLNRLLIFLPLSFGCLPFSSWLYHIPIITSYLFIYFCYLFVVIFMPWQSVLHSADSDACWSHFSLALPVNFKLSYLFAICS